MNDERVIIYIHKTAQHTTAKWHLESICGCYSWFAILDDIPDLKPFDMFSNVSIRFRDRFVEDEFYFASDGKLIQKCCCNLDFWISENKKEGENNKMLHKVTITKSEEKVLEEYWLMRAIKENPETKAKTVVKESECTQEPTLEEIALFLENSDGNFVSVEHNYRFADLPF